MLNYILIGLLILIQRFIIPRISSNEIVTVILPIMTLLLGIYNVFIIKTNNLSSILVYVLLSIVLFFMAYTAQKDIRKEKQNKFSKDHFKNNK